MRDDYAFSQLDLAQIEALRGAPPSWDFRRRMRCCAGIAALATQSDEQLRAEIGAEATPKERG